MVRDLITYVMRGRFQAILIALLFALLPFFGWVSDAIVALVTLRKGIKEGLIVLLWAILPVIAVGIVVAYKLGHPQMLLYNVVGISLITYSLAIVLRTTVSWRYVIYLAALLGTVIVLIIHGYNPNIKVFWEKTFVESMSKAVKFFAIPIDVKILQQMPSTQSLIAIATGMQVATVLIADLFVLTIARWWQSLLYNPGGVHQELYSLRLHRLAIVLPIFVILGWWFQVAWIIDSSPVILLPLLLAGLSLLHSLAIQWELSKFWLAGFYALFILFFQLIVLILIVAALLDSWCDFRLRIKKIEGGNL